MALSPMMQQYRAFKEQYKDCLLFFRLGDFYEMFFEDAVTASRELELTLTGRDCGLETRAPMCGVPYMAVDSYIAKLVDKGYKVAICEQLTAPTKPGVMLERDVVRVVTKGTVTDNAMLDDKVNNYIAAAFLDGGRIGLAWCDITTGEFYVNEFCSRSFEQLNDALTRIAPSEVICNEPMLLPSKELVCVKSLNIPVFSTYREEAWRYADSLLSLSGKLNDAILENKRLAVTAAGALFGYIKEMQKRPVSNIESVCFEDETQYLYLDASTRKNLELTTPLHGQRGGNKGTLLWLLDRTHTAMGRRMLHRWTEQPSVNLEVICARQDCVEELAHDAEALTALGEILDGFFDIERLSAKAAYHCLTPKDMGAIRNSLLKIPAIKEKLMAAKSHGLQGLGGQLLPLSDLLDVLCRALAEVPPSNARDGDFVKSGYCKELDEVREIAEDSTAVLARLEQSEKETTGIKNLRVGYNRVFGYYLEIPKSQVGLAPFHYNRKQTTTNTERYTTDELKEIEARVLGGKDRALGLELEIFEDLCGRIEEKITQIQAVSKMIATADCFVSLAEVAAENRYVRPKMTDDGIISIQSGRHPTLEHMGGELFVPNDTLLDGADDRVMIITGPNMAGKSTYMRQVALLIIMAHIGSFVPAKSAHISLTDRVFTRIGASDDILSGRSTFMVEMLEVSGILDNATPKSLLLLDEIGRGTSTYDGLSIAWAVMEYIAKNLHSKTLFSTHYHELTELEQRLPGVKNYRIAVKEVGNTIVFLHKIARGSANRSYGIEVATLAGVRKEVIERAAVLLKQLRASDINASVADKVSLEQTTLFDDIDMKRYSEVKDILKSVDINSMTPLGSFEILCDLCQRMNG